MKSNSFKLMDRVKSLKFAVNGIKLLLKNEHNARVHLLIALIVIIASYVFSIDAAEFMFIIISIGLVFIVELLNTAIENIANFVEPKSNEKIGEIKDYAAGAVLVSAIVSIIIGLIIFIPKILNVFN